MQRVRRTMRRLAAKGTAALSPSLEHRLLVLRSRRSGRPSIGLPDADRVLVIAPHPDDETLMAGGTLALLADGGATIEVVVVTDGDASRVDLPRAELARRRRSGVEGACRELGLPAPVLLGLPDGEVTVHIVELASRIAEIMEGLRPRAIVVPWFGDEHEDHRAVSLALARARSRVQDHVQDMVSGIRVWGGEVWTPLPATHLVDITATVDRKRRAIAAHAAASEAFDLEARLGLDRYRSLQGLRGRGSAEAFAVLGFGDYVDAVSRWLEDPQTGLPT